MNRLARMIRRHRVAWLERKADELEREFTDPAVAPFVKSEADQMRRKAAALRL